MRMYSSLRLKTPLVFFSNPNPSPPLREHGRSHFSDLAPEPLSPSSIPGFDDERVAKLILSNGLATQLKPLPGADIRIGYPLSCDATTPVFFAEWAMRPDGMNREVTDEGPGAVPVSVRRLSPEGNSMDRLELRRVLMELKVMSLCRVCVPRSYCRAMSSAALALQLSIFSCSE